jgi:hypothetical protein
MSGKHEQVSLAGMKILGKGVLCDRLTARRLGNIESWLKLDTWPVGSGGLVDEKL